MLIDVHAHLYNEKFKDILPKIIDECKLNKVQQIINNGLNFQSNLNSLNLAKKYNIIKAALGLYPLEAEKITKEEFDNIVKLISDNSKNIIAIGEIGLDGKYGINHELQEENLLTETDSPYQYTNNEFNKPSFVSFSIQMIAKIKNITETDAKNKIFQNFKRIF